MLMLTVINFSRLNLNVFELMRGVNGCLLTTCKSRVFVGEYCIANLVVLCTRLFYSIRQGNVTEGIDIN